MPLIPWRQEDRPTRRSSRIGTHQRLRVSGVSEDSRMKFHGNMFWPIKDTHKRPALTKYLRAPKEMHRMVETLLKGLFSAMGVSSLAFANGESRPLSDASNHLPQLSFIVAKPSA